ncbi:ribosome biogenesis protein Nop16 [Lentinula lateritia]|uniref:Nucleolar protein 16 n=1 Tax=Lentinula lateritia TaxID=40482 RepID=A0ABQ8V869_9AGAR|nr:ribosome biogenesis protein Nop16 [Lentinula lateritia]
MANPRQRRKARSSSHRAISHSKHAKRNLKKMPPIRAPKVLQQAWDNKKTVRQNYAALGLVHDLDPSESGGAEIINLDKRTNSGSAPESSIDLTDLSTSANPPSSADPELPLSHASAGATKNAATKSFLPKGHGRIFRDDAGNVVRVELPDEEIEIEDLPGNRDIDMEQLEPQLDENTRQTWISDLGGLKTRLSTNRNTTVVKELETLSTLASPTELKGCTTLSASLTGVGVRHTSQRELAYLQRLMERHKGDVEAMARDRKLNTAQRTAGELRRALKRAGTVVAP